MQGSFTKEYIEQLLAEIKYYLEPTEKDLHSKQFLIGLCFGLYSALDGRESKEYIDAMNLLVIKTKPYHLKKTAN